MTEPANADDEPLRIDLKILCNAVTNPIILPGLPLTTSVADLKTSVQNALESRPATERMRFIYRGRILRDDENQLGNIFGIESIRQCREQIIHLVIPDHPNNRTTAGTSASPLPRPSTVPPPNSRQYAPLTATQPGHTNPFRLPQPGPRPQSQPPPAHAPNTLHPQTDNGPRPAAVPQVPIIVRGMPQIPAIPQLPGHPPNIQAEIQNIMNQQIQTMVRHAQAQVQQGIAQQRAQMERDQPQAQTNSQDPAIASSTSNGSSRPHNIFQQVIAQQQQQRAAAVAQGNGTGENGDAAYTPSTGSEDQQEPTSLPNGDQTQSRSPGSVSIRREGVTRNGAHWSFAIDSTVRLPAQLQGVPAHASAPQPQPLSRTAQFPPADRTSELREVNLMIDAARRSGVEALATINNYLARPPTTGENGESLDLQGYVLARDLVEEFSARIDFIQSMGQQLRQLQTIQRDIVSLRTLQQTVVTQLDRLQQRTRLGSANDLASGAAGSPPSSTPGLGAGSTWQPTYASSSASSRVNPESPEVYLLSGPQGPYGLVFSNSGAYSTAPLMPPPVSDSAQGMANLLQQRLAVLRSQLQNQTQRSLQTSSGATATNQVHNAQEPNVRADQQQAAGPADQAPEQPGLEDLQQQFNIIRPAALLGHIWLAVRLLFFMYMLSGGPGWRRPLMFAGIAIVIYLGRLGIFNNQVDRARRHFEGLLPLPEERRREEEERRAAEQAANPGGNDGRPVPTPEETAQRLVREQGDQIWLRVRDSLQMVERAVALFVASLWPGLGERMIADREARLRERRAQEEQRQQDEEAQRQQNLEPSENQTEENAEQQNADVSSGSSEHVDKGKGRADATEGASASASASASSASASGFSSGQARSRAPNSGENQEDVD